MSWREFWNADTPIYVNERHKVLHYRQIARDIVGWTPSPHATVLDYGSGEALGAAAVAAACEKLILCDGAPLVRARLVERLGANPKIEVLAPEEMQRVADHSVDLVVVNSLLQYLSPEELDGLLGLWRSKLAPAGRLVLADVIPDDASAIDDVRALLAFAWRGGFLGAAIVGLARTALSSYRKLRTELGLAHYGEAEMLELLRRRGFSAVRRPRNMGHNQGRMTFLAVPD